MIKNKFTHGPWVMTSRHATLDYAPQFGIYAKEDADDLAIVRDEANALLIAAAPELLTSLREILDGGIADPVAVRRAYAAIAKATGVNINPANS